MNKNKHKLYMAQILSLIFKDKDLCNVMAFKGGTSLMFFHNLNRFSTDLDFNLLDPDKLDMVYDKVRAILTRFGTIDDEAKKLYGPVFVLIAHKLCAMGERLSPRDIYDVWFFLQNHTEINEEIVMERTGKSISEYAAWCAEHVREASPKLLMQGLGEALNDTKSKTFVRSKLINETSSALELFSAFPLIAK